ncbi:MAG: YdaU family protein [Afipia sp.]|nr:YdaU family protein [Afipia sp.]
MTEPLTPPELDLRDFPYMPLDVVRLRDSDLAVVASGEEFRTAVLLWCASWHQVPAASLPSDDRLLASLAGFGRDLKGWKAVREAALRGFVKCDDGRLYHPVIAEKAIEAGTKRRNQRGQTAAATEARRLAKERRDAERDLDRYEQRNDERNDTFETERNVHQGKGSEGKGPESNRIEKRGESNSPSNLKLVEEGEAVLIDETYQPSDRAIEYAYSLGMKKLELEAELRKFVNMSVAARAKSFNPDMSFKAWCDRWLDFKRKNNPEWKPAPDAPAEVVEDRSAWPIICEGTLEHTCWNMANREKGLRPLFLCNQIDAAGKIYERAARCPTLFPEGWNDFGERIPPANSEVSAA